MNTRTISTFGALAVAAVIALTGCAPSADATSADAPATSTTSAADSVTVADGWVKAAASGMSAAFGEVKNSGTEDVTIDSVTSAASSDVQLHETVLADSGEMMMQQKDGGFVIPAGGSFVLAPGGNHIMLMGLVDPIMAGAEVTFTLTFSDGSSYDFTVPAKDYSGANETYSGDDMEMGDDTDMGDSTDMGN